jgi:hypothetical protein
MLNAVNPIAHSAQEKSMIVDKGKTFEQPDAGMFLGTIIDVVDLGEVTSKFDGSVNHKLRIVWVLDKNDSTGKPFGVIATYNAHMAVKGNLYKATSQILNVPAPPVPFDTENLIGRSNQLFLVKNTAPDGNVYTNVGGIAPLQPGQTGPQAPKGFVRAKDRPKTAGPNPAARNTAVAVSAPEVDDSDIPF